MINDKHVLNDEIEDEPVSESDQLSIDQLVEKALNLQSLVDVAENQLKELQKEYRQVVEVELVRAVLATGFKSGETLDGAHKIKIATELRVRELLTPENRREIMRKRARWLEKKEGESLIRESIEMDFGKDEHDEFSRMTQALNKIGARYEVAETINTGNLKKFVNEKLEEGNEVPLDELGLYQRTEAKISNAARKWK